MNWAVLLTAIMMVESGGEDYPKGSNDNGKAVGAYQIHQGVLDDLDRVYGLEFKHEDMHDRHIARYVCYRYLRHYGRAYQKRTGKEPTTEVYARIWNGGPYGYKKQATLKYWAKVRKELK